MNVLRKKVMPRYLNQLQDGEGQDSFKDRMVLDNLSVPDPERRQSLDGDLHNVCYRNDQSWSRNMWPASDA